MGHEAAVTKKKVLDVVRHAVTLANECNVAVATMQGKHNTLAQQTSTDVAALTKRADAASAWCQGNERALAQVSKDLASLKTVADAQVEAHGALVLRLANSNHTTAEGFHAAAARLERLEDELAAFAGLTFVQRLHWLCTGRWPRPIRHGDGLLAAPVAPNPTTDAFASLPRASHTV